jgi:hypothetical protein
MSYALAYLSGVGTVLVPGIILYCRWICAAGE